MGKDYEEFRDHGKEMVDYICDYIKSLPKRTVTQNLNRGFLAPTLPGRICLLKKT